MDLSKAVEVIQQTTRDAMRATTIPVPGGGPANQYYLCAPGKEPRIETALPPPRAYKAASIEGFCEVVSGLSADSGTAVFVGEDRVTAVLKEGGDRLDRVTLDLPLHEAFLALWNWDEEDDEGEPVLRGVTQRDLAWKLRTTFSGRYSPENLLSSVQQLRIKTASDGSSDVRLGRETMSREVLAEALSNGAAVPESCEFAVPVYGDLVVRENHRDTTFEATVRCAVNLDMGEGTFTVRPLPDELERAWRLAQQWVADAVRLRVPAGVRVFVNAAC